MKSKEKAMGNVPTNDLYCSIGQRIQARRKDLQITQEALAEKLNVTPKHVSEVERGISSYSLDKMAEVSHLLDCSMDYLFFGYDSGYITAMLPESIVELIFSDNEPEIKLLLEYLKMFSKLRENQTS